MARSTYRQTTDYGFRWGWRSRRGRNIKMRVTCMGAFPSHVVLGVDVGPEDRPICDSLQIAATDGGRKLHVWRGNNELVEASDADS